MAQLRVRCGVCQTVICRMYLRDSFQLHEHDVVEPKLRCPRCKQIDGAKKIEDERKQREELKQILKESRDRRKQD